MKIWRQNWFLVTARLESRLVSTVMKIGTAFKLSPKSRGSNDIEIGNSIVRLVLVFVLEGFK
jgi:hypothetical protein